MKLSKTLPLVIVAKMNLKPYILFLTTVIFLSPNPGFAQDEDTQYNPIVYTSVDGKEIKPAIKGVLGSNIKKNRNKDGVGSIICKDPIVNIGNAAFAASQTLSSMILPEGVESIGSEAFQDCSELESIELSGSLETIGGGAFKGCSKLKEITLPENLKTIGSRAFEGCSRLKKIIVPQGVAIIGESVFDGCTDLKEIVILSHDAVISDGAFRGCSGRLSLMYDLPDEAYSTLLSGSSFEIIDLMPGVQSIGNHALEGYSSLTRLTIPQTVSHIGRFALYGFNGSLSNKSIADMLGKVLVYESEMRPETMMDIWEGHIVESRYSAGKGMLAFDEVIDTIPEAAFAGDKSLRKVFIPGGISTVGNRVFKECSSLSEVSFGNGVKAIGPQAFQECVSLEGISIPKSMESIGDNSFQGCRNLRNIDIPRGGRLVSIGEKAFEGCEYLRDMAMPDEVTFIGSEAFSFCKNLGMINLPDCLETIPNGLFNHCWSLEYVGLPSRLKTIEEYSFSDCGALADITFPKGLESIGGHAFENCSSLERIILPESLKSIGNYSFSRCASLLTVRIKGHLEEIGEGAFKGCDRLQPFEIPSSLKKAGEKAFAHCPQICSEMITFPEQAETGEKMFEGSGYMTSVLKYLESLESRKENVDEGLSEVIVPEEETAVPQGYSYGLSEGNHVLSFACVSVSDKGMETSLKLSFFTEGTDWFKNCTIVPDESGEKVLASVEETDGKTVRFTQGGPYGGWDIALDVESRTGKALRMVDGYMQPFQLTLIQEETLGKESSENPSSEFTR
ncbi:MAG: leucine-rich repeat domain-containing protein [Bacteroidaceae bacterium]|nr:leucine-rich repeat domain-containing protein [Bacteroidaceae bacterium]